eukprot:6748233-Alexandrium_andersonii.AAC.1
MAPWRRDRQARDEAASRAPSADSNASGRTSKPASVRFQSPPEGKRRKSRPRRNRSRPSAADQQRAAGTQVRWRVDGAPWG